MNSLLRTFVLASAALGAGLAQAQPLQYGLETTPIRAGVLVVAAQSTAVGPDADNFSPHVFYALSQDRTVKPANWVIENPAAETLLSQTSSLRWNLGGSLAIGSPLSKRDAAYWEVDLGGATPKQLARYDILFLAVNSTLRLTPAEREKLRGYVDGGGVLWVDYIQNGANQFEDLANSLPGGFAIQVATDGQAASLRHPLMSRPNRLEIDDVSLMGFDSALRLRSVVPGDLAGNLVLQTLPGETATGESIVGSPQGASVLVNRIGTGYMVATTREVSRKLIRGVNVSTNPPTADANLGFRSRDLLQDRAHSSALKFLVNLISLGSTSTSTGGSVRRSSSSSVDVSAPLLERYAFSVPGGQLTDGSPPAIFNGYTVVSTGAGRLVALGSNPSDDVTLDGNPDDGVVDPVGFPGDLIWDVNVGSSLSAPTVVQVPDTTLTLPGGGPRPINQVWVVDQTSTVRVYHLETGQLLATVAPPEAPAPLSSSRPHAPAIHDGIALIADRRTTDQLGRLWMIEVRNATRVVTTGGWTIQGSSRYAEPTAPATIGYIRVPDGSGAMDRVAYVPFNVNVTQPAGFASIWLGSKGERPIRVRFDSGAGRITLTTRAGQQGLPIFFPGGPSPFGVRVSLLRSNGTPFSDAELGSLFTAAPESTGVNGEVRLRVSGAALWDWDGTRTPGDSTDDVGYRLDYTLDWGGGSGAFGSISPDAFIRGNILLPDLSSPARRIIGGLALTNQGNLIAVHGPSGATSRGGSIYNFREDGRGEFLLVYRYDLHDAFSFSVGADTVNYPVGFPDNEPLRNWLNASDVSNLRLTTGPTVRGEQVLVGVGATRSVIAGFPSATTLMLSLKAHPAPVSFEVTGVDPANDPITLVQPDLARSNNPANPTTLSQIGPGQYVIEPVEGSTSRFRVTLESVANRLSGQIIDVLSTSLPLIVRTGSGSESLLEPERDNPVSGRYNPLNWYTIFNGLEMTSPAVVAGSTAYVAGTSVLPDVISGFPNGLPPRTNGLIFALDAEVAGNDQFIRPDETRPWLRQFFLVDGNPGVPFQNARPNPAVKWPQFRGIESFDDLRVRILQASVDANTATNLAVGDGTLVVTGGTGVFGFNRADFLVIDNGRISRFDPAGNPIWSTDQTLAGGRVGVEQGLPLSSPTRIYPGEPFGYWIVDSGNDRIVRVDETGRERRVIDSFRLSPVYVPAGFGESAGLRLRRPTDIATFTTLVTPAQVAAQFPGEVQVAPNGSTSNTPLFGELWERTIVADTGNRRMVELIDRYWVDDQGLVLDVVRYQDPDNPAGIVAATNVLLWHSPEQLSGRNYAYNAIGRTFIGNGPQRRSVVAFGFGNVEPGLGALGLDSGSPDADAQSGYGGVVVYDEQLGNSSVITEFVVPALPGGVLLVDPDEAPIERSSAAEFSFASNPTAERRQRIAGLSSVSLSYVDDGSGGFQVAVMIADASGVYELIESSPGVWSVRWMLPTSAYLGMRRPVNPGGTLDRSELRRNASAFRPTTARRLESGDVLIVNSYTGTTLFGARFAGEVIVVDGRFGASLPNDPGYGLGRPNLGFNSQSVRFELPPVQGIREIERPVFAEQQ